MDPRIVIDLNKFQILKMVLDQKSKWIAFSVNKSVYSSVRFFSKFQLIVPFKSMIEEIIDSNLKIFVWDNPTVSTKD